jgi:hypothetical protein
VALRLNKRFFSKNDILRQIFLFYREPKVRFDFAVKILPKLGSFSEHKSKRRCPATNLSGSLPFKAAAEPPDFGRARDRSGNTCVPRP